MLVSSTWRNPIAEGYRNNKPVNYLGIADSLIAIMGESDPVSIADYCRFIGDDPLIKSINKSAIEECQRIRQTEDRIISA